MSISELEKLTRSQIAQYKEAIEATLDLIQHYARHFVQLRTLWPVYLISSPATMPSSSALSSKHIYDARSAKYDKSWHPDHASNYIVWTQPKPGQQVLDLACGTGLVSIPAKRAVGPTGTVTAVDVSTSMMDVGKEKAKKEALDIKWLEWDMSDIIGAKREGKIRGDYDLITCATAFVLLEDPLAAIKQWKGLLKPDGRIIVDVPTQNTAPEGLIFEEIGKELEIKQPSRRLWVKDDRALERVFTDAGMKIERSWKAPGYDPGSEYKTDDAGKLFDTWTGQVFCKAFGVDGVREEARKMFIERFEAAKGAGGVVRGEDAFYMVIGKV